MILTLSTQLRNRILLCPSFSLCSRFLDREWAIMLICLGMAGDHPLWTRSRSMVCSVILHYTCTTVFVQQRLNPKTAWDGWFWTRNSRELQLNYKNQARSVLSLPCTRLDVPVRELCSACIFAVGRVTIGLREQMPHALLWRTSSLSVFSNHPSRTSRVGTRSTIWSCIPGRACFILPPTMLYRWALAIEPTNPPKKGKIKMMMHANLRIAVITPAVHTEAWCSSSVYCPLFFLIFWVY